MIEARPLYLLNSNSKNYSITVFCGKVCGKRIILQNYYEELVSLCSRRRVRLCYLVQLMDTGKSFRFRLPPYVAIRTRLSHTLSGPLHSVVTAAHLAAACSLLSPYGEIQLNQKGFNDDSIRIVDPGLNVFVKLLLINNLDKVQSFLLNSARRHAVRTMSSPSKRGKVYSLYTFPISWASLGVFS